MAQSAPGTSAGGQNTFSLSQILDSIDVHNPGLQQFALKTKASYAMGDAAKGWAAPTAGIGLSEFPYASARPSNGMGTMPRKMLMLRLQQMFPNFTQQKRKEAYYRSYARQYADERETMKNGLFAEAKMAYYQGYIAAKKVRITAEQEKQLKLLIHIAKGRLAYDKATVSDIYKARAKLSDLQSTRIVLRSKVAQAAAVLNSLMNRPADTPLKIDTAADVMDGSAAILQVDSLFVQEHRSDIRRTSDEIHSMHLKQEVAAARHRPVFGLTFDNMRMPGDNQPAHGSRYMFSAMATLSIPMVPWSSKSYKSAVQAMDYRIQAMQKMQDHQLQRALGTIRKDWLNMQSARQELQRFQSRVLPAYRKTFQANLHAFSENNGDIYETLAAWDELTDRRLAYFDKLAGLLDLRVMLEAEMQVYGR